MHQNYLQIPRENGSPGKKEKKHAVSLNEYQWMTALANARCNKTAVEINWPQLYSHSMHRTIIQPLDAHWWISHWSELQQTSAPTPHHHPTMESYMAVTEVHERTKKNKLQKKTWNTDSFAGTLTVNYIFSQSLCSRAAEIQMRRFLHSWQTDPIKLFGCDR